MISEKKNLKSLYLLQQLYCEYKLTDKELADK